MIMMMIVLIMKAIEKTWEKFVWNYESWVNDFMETQFLGNYLTKMFNKCKSSTRRKENEERWNEEEGKDI